MDTADVIVIYKQTTLERYSPKDSRQDYLDFLKKDGQKIESLIETHNAHKTGLDKLFSVLQELGLNYSAFNLDELSDSDVSFFSPEKSTSGLKPKLNLVISIGGDGTLLHASHFTGGDVCLLGVNSSPEYSVGHLCATSAGEFKSYLQEYFENKKCFQKVRRLKVEVMGKNQAELPLGLNDVLLCHLHPAATSRYQISVINAFSGRTLLAEKQQSSGVWISTPIGSTAAIKSYDLPALPISGSRFNFAARELYATDKQYELSKSSYDGDFIALEFLNRTRQGLVAIDGPNCSANLGFGERVRISLPEIASLNLCCKI